MNKGDQAGWKNLLFEVPVGTCEHQSVILARCGEKRDTALAYLSKLKKTDGILRKEGFGRRSVFTRLVDDKMVAEATSIQDLIRRSRVSNAPAESGNGQPINGQSTVVNRMKAYRIKDRDVVAPSEFSIGMFASEAQTKSLRGYIRAMEDIGRTVIATLDVKRGSVIYFSSVPDVVTENDLVEVSDDE